MAGAAPGRRDDSTATFAGYQGPISNSATPQRESPTTQSQEAASSAPSSSRGQLIIGAGPVGLYGAYYAGFRGLTVGGMDSLPEPGGQVSAMYPEKLIHDIAGFNSSPQVAGQLQLKLNADGTVTMSGSASISVIARPETVRAKAHIPTGHLLGRSGRPSRRQ
jgi:threonine dehydrogenase-like Zn-dependent dehydrogenase